MEIIQQNVKEFKECSESSKEMGRIMAVHRERYVILSEEKECYGRLKTSVYYPERGESKSDFPTVGDWVEIQSHQEGDCLITATLPRRSCFIRLNPSPGMPDQAVAANFDYVFIVMSLNQDFNRTKLERYLSVAWQSGGTPIILLSKADLGTQWEQETGIAADTAPGVDILLLSVKTGEGMEELQRYLKPEQTAVLLGSSGVGKSSLVNALMGQEVMDISEIREADSQGRHTTTHRQSFVLPSGAVIIDTPGMRKLNVSDAADGMSKVFRLIEELSGQCRYRNCSHNSEQGCAILEALSDGRLTQKQWETYEIMRREEAYARKRAERLERRQAKPQKKYNKKNRKWKTE